MAIELQPSEILIKEGMANLQRGWEAVGGHLDLTDRRLRFSAHRFNVQTGITDIPLSDIVAVRLCWTKFLGLLPLFPNSLAVELTTGVEHRFVLYGRQGWANAIRAQIEVEL